MDPQLRIDDGERIGPHLARSNLVVVRDRGPADVVAQVASRGDGGPRVKLLATPLVEGARLPDLPAEPKRRLQCVDICLLLRVRGVDERWGVRLGRGESERGA